VNLENEDEYHKFISLEMFTLSKSIIIITQIEMTHWMVDSGNGICFNE